MSKQAGKKWVQEYNVRPTDALPTPYVCSEQGDQQFRTGAEAAEMLLSEALRKDPHSTDFLESLQDMLPALAPVFDRAPKYAWIAKQLLEPERAIQFRVAWLDDNGNRCCSNLQYVRCIAQLTGLPLFVCVLSELSYPVCIQRVENHHPGSYSQFLHS